MTKLYDRGAFEIASDVTYLNCAYMSPLLKEVREACEGGLEVRSRPWEIKSEKFIEDVERVRALFAQLINGDSDGVALIPAVSYGMSLAASNLSIKAGQKILVMEGQFPSNYLIWRELAKTRSAEVEVVPFPKGHQWTNAFLERLDERTAIVALEPCHWTNGSLIDLKKVGDKARSLGAAFVIDASQAAGALALDVKELQPDFLVTVGYKWLLGPFGLALLYAHPKRREGMPLEFNWMNRKGSEDFTKLCDYRTEYRDGARRYDVGERSNFLLVPMLIAALKKVLSWGVNNIQSSVGELTSLIAQEAIRHDIEPIPPGCHASHLIGLQLKGRDVNAVAAKLAQEKIFVSARGSSIRVAPHIYNNAQDVQRLFEVIGSMGNG